MVWPNTNSCRPNPGGESQESAEFQRQMEELRQRERAALQRQVSQFFIIIFLCSKNVLTKIIMKNFITATSEGETRENGDGPT